MRRLWMAGLLVAGAALALPVASCATDYQYAQYRPSYGGGAPAYRYGYDRGWREGSEEGHEDWRKHHEPRYWREGDYRDGDKGYKHWMGPKGEYVAGFRQGYEAGYRRAYAAFAPRYDDRYRYGDRDDDRYRGDDRHGHDDDWR
jgi:hypothetical protein